MAGRIRVISGTVNSALQAAASIEPYFAVRPTGFVGSRRSEAVSKNSAQTRRRGLLADEIDKGDPVPTLAQQFMCHRQRFNSTIEGGYEGRYRTGRLLHARCNN